MPSPRGFQARSPRRTKKWGNGPDSVQQAIAGTSDLLWSSGIILNNTPQATLMRIRGTLHLMGTLATSAGDGFSGASGIALVTGDAFAIGATAIPNPLTQADWDGWIWHSFWDVFNPLASSTAFVSSFTQVLQIDSKAMRKWSENFTLVGMSRMDEVGTATMTHSADTRVLVALP